MWIYCIWNNNPPRPFLCSSVALRKLTAAWCANCSGSVPWSIRCREGSSPVPAWLPPPPRCPWIDPCTPLSPSLSAPSPSRRRSSSRGRRRRAGRGRRSSRRHAQTGRCRRARCCRISTSGRCLCVMWIRSGLVEEMRTYDTCRIKGSGGGGWKGSYISGTSIMTTHACPVFFITRRTEWMTV